MDRLVLSDNQLTDCLRQYAMGQTTTFIVNSLLETEKLADTSENREMLRDQLRQVNPSSPRFSIHKYGEMYQLIREEVRIALQEETRGVVRDAVQSITSSLSDLGDIESLLQNLLNDSVDHDITSNTEFLNTVRTLASLQKVKIEGVKAVTEMLTTLMKLGSMDAEKDEP